MAKATILLVDDDEMSSQILDIILTDEDYEVDLAPTGEKSLDKISKKNYNLVLLDYILPDMKGNEIAKKIKSSNLNTKIILLSGFSNLERDNYKLYDKILLKPVDPDVIIKTITEILDEFRRDNL